MEKLKKWFDEQQVQQYGVEIQKINEGCNGVVAVSDIVTNQIIIRIPLHLIIFSDDLLNIDYKRYRKYYPHLFDLEFNEDAEFNVLALYILQERNKFHQPYFDYVEHPKNILSWSPQEVDSIGDTNLRATIQKMRIGLQRNFGWFATFYKEIYKKELKYDEFLYAYQFVMTRCFGGDKHMPNSCLVPYGDMLNHHDKCQTKQKIIGSDLVFISSQHIKKGQEVYNFFGEHSNSFLLCWYGFTYDDNIYEKVYIHYNEGLIQVSCYDFKNRNYIFKKYKKCEKFFRVTKDNSKEILLEIKNKIEQQLKHIPVLMKSQLSVIEYQLVNF